MQRKSVVLPEPLGPIITTTCPRLTDRSMPFKTVRSPKCLTIFSARTISMPFAHCALIYCSSLAPACQGTTTSARTQTYHTLSPALFLLQFEFRYTVGIQAVLDPALDEAPQSRKK